MKTNIDDATLQKIADKVFSGPNTKSGAVLTSLELYQTSPNWNGQSHNRLILIKSALDLLPEPKPPVVGGKTPGQVAHEAAKAYDEAIYGASGWKEWRGLAHKDIYEVSASAVLAAFGGQARLEAAIARMEAVSASTLCSLHYDESDVNEIRARLIAAARGQGEAESQPAVESEQAAKPEQVCTRLDCPQTITHYEGECPTCTAKPEPATFTAHGKTWTKASHKPEDVTAPIHWLLESELSGARPYAPDFISTSEKLGNWKNVVGWRYAPAPDPDPIQPWPAVGDVVTLKSGGPKMTVRCFTPESAVVCDWFCDAEKDSAVFPTKSLQPA